MKPFTFKHGQRDWAAGVTLLHLYAVVDLDRNHDFADLVRGVRAATQGAPLSHVADDWFHVTLYQFSRGIGPADRKALADVLRPRLANTEPFTVTAGSALSYPSGVVFDLGPDGPVNALREIATTAVEDVLGSADTEYETGVLHLTEAYAWGEDDSDQVQRRLRRVRPSHAPVRIDTVELVDVAADQEYKTITWTTLDRFPLGAASE